MIKIGITGSLASGKSTASKILSKKRGPLFSADDVVKKLYRSNSFKKTVAKRFNIKKELNLKKALKEKILTNKSLIKKLENMIHPFVRKKMKIFIKKNSNKHIIFLEIPLLIESKLMKYFDVIILIKSKTNIRLKRFLLKGGNKRLFKILNSKQLSDLQKSRFSDYIVKNNNNIKALKKNLLRIVNDI